MAATKQRMLSILFLKFGGCFVIGVNVYFVPTKAHRAVQHFASLSDELGRLDQRLVCGVSLVEVSDKAAYLVSHLGTGAVLCWLI